MRFFVLCCVLAVISYFVATSDSASVTRHDAKLATFKLLLRTTEQQADSIDPTQAAITVRSCVRAVGGGWVCRGSLAPVLESGIPTTCNYVVRVTAARAKTTFGSC